MTDPIADHLRTPVDAFLVWAEQDRERSVHTIARYRAVLASVAEYGDPVTITVDQLERWWESRIYLAPGTGTDRQRRAAASRSNELACLRTFYKWCAKFDHRLDDPTRRLDAPKVLNHVPRPIGESDLTRLLGELTADQLDLRRAIALGAYSGMRVSEAAGLDWSGINQETRRIYVRGKGKKERVFGLNPILLDKLLPETGGNVVTAGGPPISGAVLQRKINRLMARHDIDHTFHDLRKRAATLALAKVGNPVAVAQAFGWASVQTAAAYAAVSDETLDAIAQAVI